MSHFTTYLNQDHKLVGIPLHIFLDNFIIIQQNN